MTALEESSRDATGYMRAEVIVPDVTDAIVELVAYHIIVNYCASIQFSSSSSSSLLYELILLRFSLRHYNKRVRCGVRKC